MTSFPPNFIPIVDAFDQAVAALAPAKIAGPAKDPNDLSNAELVEFEDELDEFSQRKDEDERKVERLFRDALADGLIDAWVKDGWKMEVLFDRESWRPKAFGAPGFEPRTHRLTNPGPYDEREVFIERKALETWLASFMGTSGERRHKGRPPATDWEIIKLLLYAKCKKQGGVPSLAIGAGWALQADAEKFVMDILNQRDETASESTVRSHVVKMLRDYEANEGR